MTNNCAISDELEARLPDLSQPIEVGGIKLRNRAFLAPMSGVTDLPFRKLAWRFGAGLVVSEMVASEALLTGHEEMQVKMMGEGMPLHVVQLAGREAKWMGLAAQKAEAHGAQIIDINMGCPARKVTNGYSGSALMRDLDHALTLVDAVVDAVDVPVTLKMRLGWDEHNLNAPDLARRAVDAGVQMITVHGRTRQQFYKGEADWQKVAAVREAVRVPLIVNGDIADAISARTALAESGADAVMIGRASYGAPWLPGKIARHSSSDEDNGPDMKTRLEIVLQHYEDMLSFYGSTLGIRQARKHLGWYLDGIGLVTGSSELRQKILTGTDPQEVQRNLAHAFTDTFADGFSGEDVPKSRIAA